MILSDATIQEMIGKGGLVIGGDPTRARHNSYPFRAGKVFHPGPDGEVVDWSRQDGPPDTRVLPGQMVWVRVRECVKLPNDLCALWWQTNTLSRNGLMLVNMSMVEPGYEGPLACLFVNFGKEPVVLYPETEVAKLVFARLDQPAASPFTYRTSVEAYDRALRDLAVRSSPSFLQVAELTSQLKLERQSALAEIQNATEDAGRKLRNDAGEVDRALKASADEHARELAEKQRQMLDQYEGDVRKATLRWLGIPGVVLIFLLALLNYVPAVKSLLRPNLDARIRDEVAAEVSRRIILSGAAVVDTSSARRASDSAAAGARPAAPRADQ